VRPTFPTTGSDFSGQLEAVGPAVQTFKAGDRVMGFNGVVGCGSHAQFLIVPETKGMLTIPEKLSYEEAGSLHGRCVLCRRRHPCGAPKVR
jgi:NADPH:quinone reductase-like Zn-dependent oxidoreductase